MLVRRNALLALDLGLHIVNFVRRFNFENDCLAHEDLDEELHATVQMQVKVKGRFLLNIVIRKGTAILSLDCPIKESKAS